MMLWLPFAFLLGLITRGRALKEVKLTISNGRASPDGGPEREVILINGLLGGPLISVEEGEELKVALSNNLDDPEYTEYFGSMSIHWHGFRMAGVQYLDGTSQVSQCPLKRTQTQQIDFTVRETPGSYFYHDHTSMLTADGLVGALVVKGPIDERIKAEYNVVDDVVLFVQDWFPADSVSQAKDLNQPFPLTSNQTGEDYFRWIGTPQSLLFNFQGCASDCTPPVGNATAQTCDPDPTCLSRYVLDVSPGMPVSELNSSTSPSPSPSPSPSIRVRLVGAGTLVYQIVCFEDHEVTLIETDARPVVPLVLPDGCVDVNLGQRMDIILKLKTAEELLSSSTQYWITGRGSGRSGMPASYGVLTYANSTALPSTPPPQPSNVRPNWSEDDFGFLRIKNPPSSTPSWVTSKQPANTTVFFDIGQPVLQQTNQIKWSLSNTVYLKTPTCSPNVLDAFTSSPAYLTDANPLVISNASAVSNVDILDMPGLGLPGSGNEQAYILLDLATDPSLMPGEPVTGTPIVTADQGAVVDIIVQDLPAGELGGVPLNRTSQEQHPMHLHGQHFYVLGSGQGLYAELLAKDPAALETYLNFDDPQLRDTETLPKGGWLYLRFRADNPGVWPFHCHIQAHEFMGMVALFAMGDPSDIPNAPAGVLPACDESCTYSSKIYGSTVGLPPETTGTGPPVATAETSTAETSTAGMGVTSALLLPLAVTLLGYSGFTT